MADGVALTRIENKFMGSTSSRVLGLICSDVAGDRISLFKPGVPSRRLEDAEVTFRVREVTEIARGLSTTTLQKKGKAGKSSQYVSIVLSDRSFDFECVDADEAAMLHEGLRLITSSK